MFTGRAVAPGEPMWTEEDIELVLEWQAEKNLIHSLCGHHLDESANPDNIRSYVAEEMTCYACAVTEWRRDALSKQDRDMAGVHIYARRIQG